MKKLIFALCTLSLAFSASAQEVVQESPKPSLEVSLKAGGHFPQVVSRLGTSADLRLKVGYAPTQSRQLQIFADLGYSQPSYLTRSDDPRLQDSGAPYQSTITVLDLHTTLGVSYFFAAPTERLLPYGGAGLRVHFLRDDVVGDGGSAFGLNQETATAFGGTLFGGAAYRLGPGLLLGELNFAFVPVGEKVTGISNVGGLQVLLGYGLLL